MNRLFGVPAAALVLALPRGAGAVEGEHALGLDVGVPVLKIADKSSPDVGAAVGGHYTYGITDQFNLTAEVQYALLALGVYTTDPPTHPSQLVNFDVGVSYVFDVIRWVPYISALAGGYLLSGGTLAGALALPGGDVAVGLDYLLTPRWGLGFEVSEHFLFTDMNLYTSYTTVFARAEFRWGK